MSREELKKSGVTYYRLTQLLNSNTIARQKRGVYLLNGYPEEEEALIQKLLPQGVYCLESAAYHYEYTTHIPRSHHLAVPRNTHPDLPDYPPITTHYWSPLQHQLGIINQQMGSTIARMYDREKTVSDYLRLRNKFEPAVVKEVLTNYLADERRDLNRLHQYGKQLRISGVLKTYLSVLL